MSAVSLGVLAALFGAPPPASAAGAPPALDLPASDAAARARAIRSRFGRGPRHPLGPGPVVVATPRFMWVEDRARTLPGPPWTTDEAYAAAFELARGAFAAREPDRARLLIVFSTFEEGGRSLFYTALANDVRGLGEAPEVAIFDATPDSALEGYAWMGALSVLEEAGPNFATEAFLHEIAHRWGAYLRLDLPGVSREVLLGRHQTHWSFLAHTENSPMEGNAWSEFPGEVWRTELETPRNFTFSPLDLYLMGVLPPREVPPFPVLLSVTRVSPSWFSARPEEAPAHRLGITVSAVALETTLVRIEDVIAAAGPRLPMAAEALPLTVPIGVVLLSGGRATATTERLEAFEAKLDGWLAAFTRATGGRIRLDAELTSAGRGGLGARCAGPEDCDRTESDRCVAEEAGEPRRCSRGCRMHADCGEGACCVGAVAPGMCVLGVVCGPGPAEGRDAGLDPTLPHPPGEEEAAPLRPSSPGCTCTRRAPGPAALVLLVFALVVVRRPLSSVERLRDL